jgi:hypothetical protein
LMSSVASAHIVARNFAIFTSRTLTTRTAF